MTMFYSLTGKVINKGINFAVISCGGVGFMCYTSRFTLYDLPDDKSEATVYTHLNVREDALDLFGFSTEYELEWFKMLITVNGVGPKAALAILSKLTVDEIALQRRIELWGEGFRYFDVRRTATGIVRDYEGSNHNYELMTIAADVPAHHKLWVFQIPQREMQENVQLTEADQNEL